MRYRGDHQDIKGKADLGKACRPRVCLVQPLLRSSLTNMGSAALMDLISFSGLDPFGRKQQLGTSVSQPTHSMGSEYRKGWPQKETDQFPCQDSC